MAHKIRVDSVSPDLDGLDRDDKPSNTPNARSIGDTTLLGLSHAELLGIASGLLCVLGAMLPWVTVEFFGTYSRIGLEGDGVLTLIAGLIVAAVIYVGKGVEPILVRLGVPIGGLFVIGVSALNLMDISDRIADVSYGIAHVGPGLYITLISGFGILASGYWMYVSRR